MGRPIAQTVTVAAAVATGYAESQSLGAAGPLTLNGSLVTGGVGIPTHPARATVASAGDDHLISFIFVGTIVDPGNPLNTLPYTETVAGTNAGSSSTVHDFATITSISGSAATASTVTAGTLATASSPWVPWDVNVRTQFEVGFGVTVLTSTTWQLEVTLDDIYDTTVTPTAVVYNSLSGKTDNETGGITAVVRASRLTLTAAGSARLSQIQQGD